MQQPHCMVMQITDSGPEPTCFSGFAGLNRIRFGSLHPAAIVMLLSDKKRENAMLYEKSLITLELPIILEKLAAETVSGAGKEAALRIRPSDDNVFVKSRLEETTAAKNMMALKSSPPFSGIIDIRGMVKRADLGGMLNTRELLDIAALLRASAAAIAYASKDGNSEKTAIDYLFMALNSNKNLENKISAAIIAEDEIADAASRELSDIRRHMRLAGDKVRQTLNKIITSTEHSKALQEPIITVRNGRYVVPVKSEHKSAIPGLVHDISSSGATLFVEPLTVVQINNELRELAAKEKQEIERILLELSADAAQHSDDIISDFDTLVELDLIFAKAKLSYKMNAVEPEVAENICIDLRKARHPLLPQDKAVPIDVRIGYEFDTLVITGPNTGGKTVALKTLGLLCIMAQCGLHIPAAEGSFVPVLDGILADIGDEQSIEQSLSTFSSHMKNITGILETFSGDSLLLFDELGAGTDPVEGAALATAIVEYARGRGALIAATTHYAELKIYAMTSPGVANASCEFDVETLKPTYKLVTGIPGKSNAFAISKRLGLPENVISDAKSRVNTENASLEDALESLEKMRLTLESERLEMDRMRRDADEDRRKAEELKIKISSEWEKAEETAKREAMRIISDARSEAESVIADLRDIRRRASDNTDWKKINDEKSEAFRRLNAVEDTIREAAAEIEAKPLSRDLVPGDKVRLRRHGTLAEVVSINPDGVLSLQAGIMKITVNKDEVDLVPDEQSREIKRQLAKSEAKLRELAAKPELDLRGMQTDEAIPILERFLDNARLAKLNTVSIIHGKGTGAMRQAVHQALRREQGRIKAFRLGRYGEGEDGVTIIEL